MPDHRDMALEVFALDETYVADVAATWREIARAAADQLHAQHVEIERLKASNIALREEIQRYVRQVMFGKARRAA